MTFYQVEDVMEMLDISRSKAYKIMQGLNKELKEKGFIIIAGKVPKKYFDERFYNSEDRVKKSNNANKSTKKSQNARYL